MTNDNKILVTRATLPEFEEYVDEIRDIWNSHWLTNMGEKHKKFQEELKKFLSVSNVELFTNGHMALEMSLQAFGFPKGSEVITTPFTFASTTHAIVRNGLIPVFCDINEEDYTIDVSKIETLITGKTVAIMPVHVYGNICDVEAIDDIAQKYDLKVIYDAAHTFGETYKGVGVGNYGDVSCFSFHATKVFNSIEGGAACFKDNQIGGKLYSLKNFGIKDEETIEGVGANAKMNEFCAAMGLCNLRHIKDNIKKRKVLVDQYNENLRGVNGVIIPKANEEVESNYSYYPIRIIPEIYGKDRNQLFRELDENNFGARKYFYPITSRFECYRNQYDSNETPMALQISNQVLTLPLYADLEIENVDRICSIISSANFQKH